MGFVEAVKTCFSKYFDFTGRARRSEYWYFFLFLIIASIVLALVDAMIFGPPSVTDTLDSGSFMDTPLSNLFSLATIVPSFSAAARRLHDIDRSGWFQLMVLVPAFVLGITMGLGSSIGLIGMIAAFATIALAILLIVWLATDGQAGDNRFGPSPK